MAIIKPLHASPGLKDLDPEAVTVLLSIPLVMITLWYFGRPDFFARVISEHLPDDLPMRRVYPFFYFSACLVVLRSVIPLLLGALITKRRPSEYGWSFKGTFDVWWGYVVIFTIVVPFIFYASTLPSFLERYPL